jgi:Heparinase II/III-like protein/Heparinase II/III N-terminus
MLAKLRGRSLAELRDRVTQSARALVERSGYSPTIHLPAGVSLEPQTPWPTSSRAEILSRLTDAQRDKLIDRADRIVAGRFDVLGLMGVSYGDPVDWQRDPVSGKSAERRHWSLVPYLDDAVVGDHKVTWEINRHQWLVVLGQAWLITHDARYVTAATLLLRSWLAENPPKFGINWCSALELAFRVQSWIHGLRLFANAPSFGDDLRRALVQSAASQVDHISQNLSTWFSPNTHLTGEALAMLSAGCAWPELPSARRWRVVGWDILCSELPKQVRNDGVYFEQSAWYQAYTVDFYVLGMAWAKFAQLPEPPEMRDRVRSAARALRALTRPDGTIARVGDDDGGRTLPLCTLPHGDMSDTLWRASVALGDNSIRPMSMNGLDSLLWLEGASAFDAMRQVPTAQEAVKSLAFRDGGLILLAESTAGTDSGHALLFDCGPHGALSHAHSHADALAIDLSVSGVPLLVDAGTGAYVGPSRQKFRSTSAHNTVTVDGVDSSEQGTAFKWRTVAKTQIEGFGISSGATWVAASHFGYMRLADPVRHHRTILRIDRHYWLMLDALSAHAPHEISLTFQAAPNAAVSRIGNAQFEIVADIASMRIALDPRFTSNIERRAVSPAYALELPADAVVASATILGNDTFCTVLSARNETGDVTVHAEVQPNVWRVTHRNGTDLVARPAGELVTHGGAAFDGTAFAILNMNAPHTVIAAGAGTLHLDGRAFTLGADDIRVARRAANGTWLMES